MINTKQNVFLFILKGFYVETVSKRKQSEYIFKSYNFNDCSLFNCSLVTHIIDRQSRPKTDRKALKIVCQCFPVVLVGCHGQYNPLLSFSISTL